MKIYVCDHCGKTQASRKGIVGQEFDYHDGKWRTIEPRFRYAKPDAPEDQVVDVCGPCFELVSLALTYARERALAAQNDEYHRIIGAGMAQPPAPQPRPGLFSRLLGRKAG